MRTTRRIGPEDELPVIATRRTPLVAMPEATPQRIAAVAFIAGMCSGLTLALIFS